MSSIRFNKESKEIELIGSESFIAANFHIIQNLLAENERLKRKNTVTKMNRRPRLLTKPAKSKTPEALVDSEVPKSPLKLSTVEPEILKVSQEPRITRPPLRKYFDQNRNLIRSEYRSVVNDQRVIGMGKSIPDPVSNGFFISLLTENFGLAKDQIEGIVRDAEREGRVRNNSDGSFEWL